VATPDGLTDAFPQQPMTSPPGVFFASQPMPGQIPTLPVRGKGGMIQSWYNQKVQAIGEDAKKKVAANFTKLFLLQAIQDNNPGGAFPNPSGVYTHPSGNTYAQAAGDTKKLEKSQSNQTKAWIAAGWTNVKVSTTVVQMNYVIDQATQNPRSGNLVVSYTYITTFTGTKNGQPVSRDTPVTNGGLLLHDDKLEKMQLVGSPPG
jgi:hypothetical protein